MAIVQISRIQVRRGQKNVGSGIPQLAGGEFGWAVDTRELFIGNGSVSEGSPAVGNTKILTQYDNLFSFADQYTYQKEVSTMQTGATAMLPTARTLQAVLDERVSVKSYGATGDGSDQTVVLQRAIDQLYLNSATKGSVASRVTLTIPAGEYLISASLKVPPYATIVGSGSDKVKITQNSNNPIFETVNSGSTPGSYAQDSSSTTLNQANKITIKGMTLVQTTTNAGILLTSCKESLFEDLTITGTWTSGSVHGSSQVGIRMNSLSTGIYADRYSSDGGSDSTDAASGSARISNNNNTDPKFVNGFFHKRFISPRNYPPPAYRVHVSTYNQWIYTVVAPDRSSPKVRALLRQ